MLYRYQIRFRDMKLATSETGQRFRVPVFCEVTMIPTWIGRLFGRQLRRGCARRAKDNNEQWSWWWTNTERYVGWRIERLIEVAPVDSIEDMPIELLLEK